jgi:hypothetical protein
LGYAGIGTGFMDAVSVVHLFAAGVSIVGFIGGRMAALRRRE